MSPKSSLFRKSLYASRLWLLLLVWLVSPFSQNVASAFTATTTGHHFPSRVTIVKRTSYPSASLTRRGIAKFSFNQNRKDPISVFLGNLWKGVTLPFPLLRRVVLGSTPTGTSLSIGLSLKDGLVAVAAYLAVGVIAYHRVVEQWTITDALYYTCVCCTTVGYGDICCSNPASKIFTCLFGLGGIAFLGAAVATIGGSVITAEVEAVKVASKESHKRIMQIFEGMPHVLDHFRSDPESVPVTPPSTDVWRNPYSASVYCVRQLFKLVLRALPSLTIIFGGAAVIQRLNGSQWSLIDTLYYALITASTIGLGDLTPITKAARIAAIIYIPLSVAAAGELLSGAASAWMEQRQRLVYEEQLQRDLTMDHLHAMDADKDGKITREEYSQFMLMEMGRVSKEELDDLSDQFERLDLTKSGYLDHEDLKLMAKLRGASVKE